MLMRAANIATQGKRVLLCDRSPSIGGAWAAPDLLGLANVENGVHLLENRPSLLSALRDDLKVDMAPSPCFGLLAGRRTSMPVTRVLLQAGAGWNALVRGELDKATRSFRSALRASLNLGAGFYYPAEGASAFIRALYKRFVDAGGEVRSGVEVSKIEVVDGGARSITTAGVFETSTVLLASRAFAPVVIDRELQQTKVEVSRCRTAILRIRGSTHFEGGYVEILADGALKRARDLSQFVRPGIGSDERILCVQFRHAFPHDDWRLGEDILHRLRRLSLIAPGAALTDVCRSDIEVLTLTDHALRRLALRSGGVIGSLRTTDFAEGFVSDFRQVATRPRSRQAA